MKLRCIPLRNWVRTWALSVCPVLAVAQAPAPPSAPSSPSAPHEKLAFFEGTWTAVDVAPEDNFVETCAWLAGGRRHMVCRSRWTSPSGPLEGMSILSYSVKQGAYLYHGIRSGGIVVAQRGTEEEGVWRFFEEQRNGTAIRRIRVTIRSPADGKVIFVRETATDDGPWEATPALHTIRITR